MGLSQLVNTYGDHYNQIIPILELFSICFSCSQLTQDVSSQRQLSVAYYFPQVHGYLQHTVTAAASSSQDLVIR